jgi:hypothetical protein
LQHQHPSISVPPAVAIPQQINAVQNEPLIKTLLQAGQAIMAGDSISGYVSELASQKWWHV